MSEELNNPEKKKENEKGESLLEEETDREEKEEEEEEYSEEGKSRKAVIIKAEAYKTIILYASRYANKAIPPANWKEIYGILIGYTDDEFVYVEEAEALTFGHSTDVQLDERHYGFIEKIENRLYENNSTNFIIGWFHSHPGLGLFFSYIDLINHLGFQGKNDDAIGLVFDHTLLGKKKEEKIGDNVLTKYDTGFEIYRLTEVSLDINAPNYDTNYHKVDYIVKGLNKFFFANVLTELSALVSAGKPLQSAYGEDFRLESNYRGHIASEEQKTKKNQKNDISIKDDILEKIPMEDEISFNGEDLFYNKESNRVNENSDIKQTAEQLIYEGNQFFKNKDVVTGVEKFEKAIDKYEELGEQEKVLELLKNLSENCISSNHLYLAEEFANRLGDLSDNINVLFFRGEANYLLGYILLKKGDNDFLSDGLKKIRDAAIIFEKEGDFIGAATCFHKIGSTYQTRLNKFENSCLFYREAIENYNKAILKSHPNRKALWSKTEILTQKILELKDIIEELLPKLENLSIKDKIRNDLDSINYNF